MPDHNKYLAKKLDKRSAEESFDQNGLPPRRMPGQQSRRWCWTLNNPLESERAAIDALLPTQSASPDAAWPEVSYIAYGMETGASGTPHLQGYLELVRKSSLGKPPQGNRAGSGVRSIRGLYRAHFEVARGTQQQCVDYCFKDGDAHEFGTRIRQGARRDLQAVRDRLASGEDVLTACGDDVGLFLQYSRGLEKLQQALLPDRTWQTDVVWIWGPTGTGKSRRAHMEASNFAGDRGYYSCPDTSWKWFDGYTGQKYVVCDDIAPESYPPVATFLRLCDRYPLQIPVKGGFVKIQWRIVWITCNFSPQQIYGHSQQYAAVARRIGQCIHIGEGGIETNHELN